MGEPRRLCIPDFEKEKGLVWAAYPVFSKNWWEVEVVAELEIKQGKN